MTFLDPLFLLGLLGVSVPLVIHMLSRRTARRQDFSTLEFLRNLERKSMRRVRVRQWLLLLLRMAIIAAVALAMARPTLTGLAAGGGRGETSAAIVLDGSFSMGGRADGRPQFEAGVERALAVLDALEKGDEVMLLVPGGTGGELPAGIRDHALVRERIATARPGLGAVDLPSAIREAVRALESARNLHREIHVISDFQRSAWPDDEAPLDLPERTGIFLHRVGGDGPAPNAWIGPVDFSGQILEKGAPIEIRTFVAAGPGFAPKAVEVELEIDGRAADRRRVDLAPASQVALTFRETFAEDGLHLGTVVLREAGGAEADDRRNFTLRTSRAVPVRLVAGSESARRFLAAALAPAGGAAGSFAVLAGETRDLETLARAREAVVVLADVERLSEGELAGLKNYLSDGGGALVFPGPRTDATAWSRSFLPKLLPGSFADVGTPDEALRIAEFDSQHPLFRIFTGGDGGLEDVRFTRALRFLPEAGTSVLASYSSGDPALVESALLPGRILMVTSAIEPSWSDLALSGAFVPLVHEAVRYLSESGAQTAREVEVGEGAVVRLARVPEGGATLRGPGGEPRAVGVEAGAAGWAAELPVADEPGFWVFESPAGDTLAALAANVPVRESDPGRLDEDELAARQGGGGGAVLAVGEGDLRQVREARLGREIGRAFLWGAVLLLLGEMLLAARFRAQADAA